MCPDPCGRRPALQLSVLLAGLLAAASSAFATVTVQVVASRTTGVAPLAVNFDTTPQPNPDGSWATTGTTSTTTSRPFHDLYYLWDYGDTGSGTWGTNGKSKNHDTGPIGGHVFETPGTYTVTLSVKETPSSTPVTAQVTITVTNPDSVYSGTNTICISTNSDFTGAPPGSQQVTTTSWGTIKGYFASGKRVLLHRGQHWDHDNSSKILTFAGPFTLGAFGDTAQPRPIIDIISTDTSMTPEGNVRIFRLGGPTVPDTPGDYRFMDIEFRGNNFDRGIFDGNGTVHDITWLRLYTHDAGKFLEFAPSVLEYYNLHGNPGQKLYHGFAVVDTQYNHIIGDGQEFNHHHLGFLGVAKSIFMGNTWNDSHLGEHVLRHPFVQREIIAHNHLTNCRDAKHIIKLHAGPLDPSGGTVPPGHEQSKFVVITDNYFSNNTSDWYLALGPQDKDHNEVVQDVILERNEVVFGAGTTGWTAFDVRADNITARNNAFIMTAAVNGIAIDFNHRGSEPNHHDNSAYNNSAYQGSTGNFTFVNISGTNSNTTVKNNLAKSNGTTQNMITGSGTNLQASNNSLTSTPGWESAAPTNALGFNLLSTSTAINQGASVPVFDDFEEAPRPQATSYDIGAFEFISTAPVVSITANVPNAAEPSTNGQFTVTASPAPTSPITVNLGISGTATNGTDYSTIANTVTVGTSGTATINVSVIDDAAVEGSETVTLTVNSGTGYTIGAPASATVTIADNDVANSVPSITTSSLPNGAAGVAYSQTLTATGGDGALTWSIVSGALPPGLTLSTGGVISGTSTYAATASFAVRVADSDGITGPTDEDVRSFTLVIDPAPGSSKFTVTGAAVTASADDGNVPANTVDSNLLTRWSAQGDGQWIQYDLGSPSTIAYVKIAWYVGDTRVATFDVQTADSSTGPWTNVLTNKQSSGTTADFEIFDFADVTARYVRIVGHGNDSGNGWNSISETEIWGTFVNSVPSVTTSSLPNGTAGTSYSQTLTGSGGNGALTWTLDSGALPTGLSLSSAGVISGTPTLGGTSVFTVRVADSDAITGPSDEGTKALTLIVNPAAGATKFTIPGPSVTASADDGNVPPNTVDGNLATRWSAQGDGQWIQYDLGSTNTVNYVKIAWYQGDTRTSTFDVQVATVSTGPWTNVLTGKVSSGTTTALEVYDFTDSIARYVRIVGHGNSTGNGWNSIAETEVWGVVNSVPNITTTTLPNGTVGTAYSQTLAATGGDGALTWSLASGTLPAGLSLSSAGVISGTPTTSGTSSFTVKVADSDGITGSGDEDTQALSVTISGLPSPWLQADIGAVGAAGTATYSSGTFSIDGSGAGIGNSADEFHYVYQAASGDCSVIAKVLSVENTNPSAKAGVMIRETLTDTSKHASVIINPGNNAVFVRRTSTGGTTSTTTQGAGIPYWVKITRVGDTFTAYRSSDGSTWTTIQSQTITMATSVYIGLAVTSTNDGTLCTSTMSNVMATP